MSGEQTTADPAPGEAVDQEQVTAAFESGFNDDEDSPQATETPPVAPAPVATPEPTAAPAPIPAPEYVQVTKEDWERVSASAAKVVEIEASIGKVRDTAFGKIGGIERFIAQLQQATPQGAAVEVSDEDFADFKEQYPELAELTKKGLNKALAKLKGSGGVDPKALDAKAGELRSAISAEVTDTTLDAIVDGDWREEVKTPRFDGWLKGQTPGVQALAASPKLRDAARMMRLYKAHADAPAAPAATPAPTPAPAPAAPAQPSMRSRQMAAAVAPKGDASAAPPRKGKTPFEQGWEDDD